MKFINFKTIEDKQSLTQSEMATLLYYENDIVKSEVTVAMINPAFDHGVNIKNKLISNYIVAIYPYTGKDSNYKFEAMLLNGNESVKTGYQNFSGLFGLYSTMNEALAEVDVCYGAKNITDLQNRKKAFRKVWNDLHKENEK